MDITYTVEEVNPAKAAELLTLNTHNRNISQSFVDQLSKAMSDDEWYFNGAPVLISKTNVLVDGQHRLSAIVASGTTQNILIVRGVDDAAQDVTDTGRKRSFSNALTLAGESNSALKAAVTSILWQWERGARGSALTHIGGVDRPQIPALKEFFSQHREEIVGSLPYSLHHTSVPVITPRLACLAYIIFSRIDEEDADIFFSSLESGAGLEAKDPILVLRNRFFADGAKSGYTDFQGYIVLALMIKAWNFWRDGAEITLLRYKPNGSGKESFPEPH